MRITDLTPVQMFWGFVLAVVVSHLAVSIIDLLLFARFGG